MRDPQYLAFIRRQPCLACRRGSPVVHISRTEAHHYGPHGLSQKAPDRMAIPLCGIEHHRLGPESVHQLGKRFAEHHGLDIDAEVQYLNELYDRGTK